MLSEEIIMHPDYNSRNMENDICLVKVPSLAKNSKTSGCVKNGRSCMLQFVFPAEFKKLFNNCCFRKKNKILVLNV